MTIAANGSLTEAGRVSLLQALHLRNDRAISRLVNSGRNSPDYRKAKEDIDRIAIEELILRMPVIVEPDEIRSDALGS